MQVFVDVLSFLLCRTFEEEMSKNFNIIRNETIFLLNKYLAKNSLRIEWSEYDF